MAAPRADQARPNEEATYTSIAISVKFENEAVGTLMASWDSSFTHPIELMEICGTKGYLQVENIVEGVKLFPHGDETVRSGREPAPTGEDGLKALYVVRAAIESFEEKRVVEL